MEFWKTLLTSSVIATTLTGAINFGIEDFYRKPKELDRVKTERKADKKRIVAEDLLNRASALQKGFEGLLMQPDLNIADAEIRLQSKFLLKLSDEVHSECLNKPFVEELCKIYKDWHNLAVPVFEKLAGSEKGQSAIIKNIQEDKSKNLRNKIDDFRLALKKVIEEGY